MSTWKVEVDDGLEAEILARRPPGVRRYTERDEARRGRLSLPARRWRGPGRPIVVGAGPAGLFAAWRLAEAGAPVLLLERGDPVEERQRRVRRFLRHGELDPESNLLFGEGGAGTFSDGKIYTRRRDGEVGWILRVLVEHGADPAILEEGWAHIGTDRIREILPRMRAALVGRGAEIRFRAAVADLLVEERRCVGVRLADGEEIAGSPVLVAPGHSARDTWAMLVAAGARAVQRPIRVGVRVEHPQKRIDLARYGRPRGELPAASYRLRSHPPGGRVRAAHTFCMCPGGTVVPATNHPGRVVVNGMSFSRRASWWANSAVVAEVPVSDYDDPADPLAGVRYQDALERAAFAAGGGAFRAPAQRLVDFLDGRVTADLPRVSYPRGVTPADLRAILPEPVAVALAAAFRHFDRRLPGFICEEAVLIAPESRTTSPVRFLRDEAGASPTVAGLHVLGEGAGYAGGIASAALDGLRAAEAILAAPATRPLSGR